jgi:hypothetical protein
VEWYGTWFILASARSRPQCRYWRRESAENGGRRRVVGSVAECRLAERRRRLVFSAAVASSIRRRYCQHRRRRLRRERRVQARAAYGVSAIAPDNCARGGFLPNVTRVGRCSLTMARCFGPPSDAMNVGLNGQPKLLRMLLLSRMSGNVNSLLAEQKDSAIDAVAIVASLGEANV